MPALRCTKRLLRRLRQPAAEPAAPPENALGHWYANIMTIRRVPMVLALSETSLLAVLVPGAPFNTLPSRVTRAVADLLPRIGIAPELVQPEIAAMTPLTLAPTASRKVLGCLNRMEFELEVDFDYHPERTIAEREEWMSENIYTLTGYRYPREIAADLLASKWGPM